MPKPSLPEPKLPPSAKELEDRRQAEIDVDPLPADLKAALAVQKSVNNLPEKTPGKEARLKRLAKHVESLCAGTNPPRIPFQPLRPLDTDYVNRVRAGLTKKK